MIGTKIDWWRIAAVTSALAVFGLFSFGALHAWLIAPIWGRLAGGVPFAIGVALALLWCHVEVSGSAPLPVGWRGGAVLGAALWASLLPMTLLAEWIRATGLASGLGDGLGSIEAVVELIVVAVTGGGVARAVCRRWRPALAAAVCCAMVALAMAGPVAIGQGPVHRWLFVGFLPILTGAGVLAAVGGRGGGYRHPS